MRRYPGTCVAVEQPPSVGASHHLDVRNDSSRPIRVSEGDFDHEDGPWGQREKALSDKRATFPEQAKNRPLKDTQNSMEFERDQKAESIY